MTSEKTWQNIVQRVRPWAARQAGGPVDDDLRNVARELAVIAAQEPILRYRTGAATVAPPPRLGEQAGAPRRSTASRKHAA